MMTPSSSLLSLFPSGTFQRWWEMAWPVRSTTQKLSWTSQSRTWPSASRSCNSKSWATGWKMRWMVTTWTSRMRVGSFWNVFPIFSLQRKILYMTHSLMDFSGEDISGSGSGMCAGGQCSRNRPGLYTYSPDNNRVRGAATSQSRLCGLLLLLPLAILLFQRWLTAAAFNQTEA